MVRNTWAACLLAVVLSCNIQSAQGQLPFDASDSGEGRNDWQFLRDVWIHDQGGLACITTDESPPRLLELRLREAEWPARDRRASLTLYVHEAGNDRALSYTWGEAGAERLGLNLRGNQTALAVVAINGLDGYLQMILDTGVLWIVQCQYNIPGRDAQAQG